MLRRQLIAYPAAALFAVAGTAYSYHALQPAAARVVRAATALSTAAPRTAHPAAVAPTDGGTGPAHGAVALAPLIRLPHVAAPATPVVRSLPVASIAPATPVRMRRVLIVRHARASGAECAACAAARRAGVSLPGRCEAA